MVQILRDSMRNYEADVSGAIRTSQIAANIGEWNQVIQGAGRIAGSIMERQADKAAAEAKEQAALEADWTQRATARDRNIIDTEIGMRAENDLIKWNTEQYLAGTDVTTDAYTKALYAKRDELYAPYISKMQTETGRNLLQEQGLKAVESLRKANYGKLGEMQKRRQAEQAFSNVAAQTSADAREFGKLGDMEGFQEATKNQTDNIVKYMTDSGVPKEQAQAQVDMNNIVNFLSGMAETQPEAVIAMLEPKDYKEEAQKVADAAAKTGKKLSDKEIESIRKELQSRDTSKEDLAQILPDSFKEQITNAITESLSAEKEAKENELKDTAKGSRKHEIIKNQISEIDKKLEAPEIDLAEALKLNKQISEVVLPSARKQAAQNELAQKQAEEKFAVDTYTMAMSPDTSVSTPARMALVLNKPDVEKLFNMSIPQADIDKAYTQFIENDQKVLETPQATFEGTFDVYQAMYDLSHSTEANPMKALINGLNVINALREAPITQEQYENGVTIANTMLKDRVFKDVATQVFANTDRFFPDTSWMANAFAAGSSYKEAEERGLPSTNIKYTDKDSVQAFLDTEAVRIANEAYAQLAIAAKIPDQNQRTAAVNQIANWLEGAKKDTYNKAIINYGIDLKRLDEELATKGHAYSQIGFRTWEYAGRDSDGITPLWKPFGTSAAETHRKQMLERLGLNKPQENKKAE